ncbi:MULTISPECIES: DUF6305 family protein [unclassified Virgibacillus]|uniref:DUF6305 family protein n=1 Tax=unclassified Virgibacillus TaxID=2620237 RepID=UPI0024DEF5EA|nr:DUF6305 family protein [Virgibacillus sp. LDC-1]
MKKYIPATICFFILILFVIAPQQTATKSKPYASYPNLPAPIGDQKLLITSAGQAVEASILYSIAEHLHLDVDYRPRVLASDLYDYNTVAVVIGYSANGMTQVNRTFEEEVNRIKAIAEEVENQENALILVHLSGNYRSDRKSLQLFEQLVQRADYYIGMKENKYGSKIKHALKQFRVPATFVSELDDIRVPFNSAFR